MVTLNKDIQEETQPSSQVENIEDEVKAIFKARSKTTENKADKVDKTELLKLSAKEVARIDLFTIPTI